MIASNGTIPQSILKLLGNNERRSDKRSCFVGKQLREETIVGL